MKKKRTTPTIFMKTFQVVKSVRGVDISDALRRERSAEIISINEVDNTPSEQLPPAIGFDAQSPLDEYDD